MIVVLKPQPTFALDYHPHSETSSRVNPEKSVLFKFIKRIIRVFFYNGTRLIVRVERQHDGMRSIKSYPDRSRSIAPRYAVYLEG